MISKIDVEKINYVLHNIPSGVELIFSDLSNIKAFTHRERRFDSIDLITIYAVCCQPTGQADKVVTYSESEFMLYVDSIISKIIDWKVI